MDESARPNEEEKLLEAPPEEPLLDQPAEEKLIPAHTTPKKSLFVKILLGISGIIILLAVAYAATTFFLTLNTPAEIVPLPIEGQPLESAPVESNPPPVMPGEDPQKACTLEAKLCPDGSSVGRTGPNCEFAACPGE